MSCTTVSLTLLAMSRIGWIMSSRALSPLRAAVWRISVRIHVLRSPATLRAWSSTDQSRLLRSSRPFRSLNGTATASRHRSSVTTAAAIAQLPADWPTAGTDLMP
jgi:hypothetical protein